MIFDILTLFPEAVNSFLSSSIIGRAREKGSITVRTWNIRDFSKDKHKKVDDYPYGGGSGMVMTPQPIHDAWLHVTNGLAHKPKTIYLSPQGRVLTQDIARSLLQEGHIILLCGHYEGVDERILEEIVDEEISIGDYVLTGGELAAMVLVDCIGRMVDGVLACEEAFSEESHFDGLLEYPQYSRPPEYLGKSVPDILLSGHHVNIQKWRFEKKLERTREKRPDLYEKYRLSHPEENKVKKAKRRKDKSVMKGDVPDRAEQDNSTKEVDVHHQG
ncbi:MAG: tRNA (guanosine(37)-N1)-methyltransferase TrmD [Thermoclostridium sp.]|nr:tRNA (guanosine(37)-N1)-methyltransferase TrmD [Thermoclostridium sp.]